MGKQDKVFATLTPLKKLCIAMGEKSKQTHCEEKEKKSSCHAEFALIT